MSHSGNPGLHQQQSIQTWSNTSATTSTMSTLTRSFTARLASGKHHRRRSSFSNVSPAAPTTATLAPEPDPPLEHATKWETMSKSIMNLVGISKDKDKDKDCNGSDKAIDEPAKKLKPSLPALFRKSHKTDKDISVELKDGDPNATYEELVADPFRMSPVVPHSPGPKAPSPTTSLLKSLSDSSTSAVPRPSIDIAAGETIDFHNSLMGRARGGSGTIPRKPSAPNVLLVGNMHPNDLFNTNAHPMSPERTTAIDLSSNEVSAPVHDKDGSTMATKRARSSTAPPSPARYYPQMNMAGVGASAARNSAKLTPNPPPVPPIPISLAHHSPSPIVRPASAAAVNDSTASRSVSSPLRYTGACVSRTPSASSKTTAPFESRLMRRPNAPPTAAELFAALENSVDVDDLPSPTHDYCKSMFEESSTTSTSVTGDNHDALKSVDTEESIYSDHAIDEKFVVIEGGAVRTETSALDLDDDDRPLSLVSKQLLSSGAKPRERSKTFSTYDRPSSSRGVPSSRSGRGHQSRSSSISARPGSTRSETGQPTSAASLTRPASSSTPLSNPMAICNPRYPDVAQRKFRLEAATSASESDDEKDCAPSVCGDHDVCTEESPSKATGRRERRVGMYVLSSAPAAEKKNQRLSTIRDASPDIRKRETVTTALGLFHDLAQHGEFSPRPPSPPMAVDELVYSVAPVPSKAALALASVELAAKCSPTELDENDADVKRGDSDEEFAAQGELLMITSNSGHNTMILPDSSVEEGPMPSALSSETPRRTDMHATLRRSALILRRSSKTLGLSSNLLRSNTDEPRLSEAPRASILNRGDSAPSSSNADRFPAAVYQPHHIDSQCHDVDLLPSATCQLDFGDGAPDSFLPSVLTSAYLPHMHPSPYLPAHESHSPPIQFAHSPESMFVPSLLSDGGSSSASDTGYSAKGEEWSNAPSPIIRGELENIRAMFNPRRTTTALPPQDVPNPISTWCPQGTATPLPRHVTDVGLTESNSTSLVDRVAKMPDGAGFEEQALSSAFYIGMGLRTGVDSVPCHPEVVSEGKRQAEYHNHPPPSSLPHVKHCRAESRVDGLQSAQSPVDRRSPKPLELEEFPLLAQPALSYPQIVAASSSGLLSNSLELDICGSAVTALLTAMSQPQPPSTTSNTSPAVECIELAEADFNPPLISTPPRPNRFTSNSRASHNSYCGKGGLTAVDALLQEMLSESIGGTDSSDLSQDSSPHLNSKDWPLPPGIATFRPLQPKLTTAAPDLVRAFSDTARPPHYVGSMSPVEPPKARRASGPDSRLGTTASSEGSSVASTTTLIQLSIDGDHASIMTNPIILSMDQQPSFTIKAADVITLERFCKLWPDAVFSVDAERSKHLHVKVEVEDKLGVVTMTFKLADTAHMPEEDSSLPGPIIKFSIGLPKSLKSIMQVVSLIGV